MDRGDLRSGAIKKLFLEGVTKFLVTNLGTSIPDPKVWCHYRRETSKTR